jgi:hypothetical protein
MKKQIKKLALASETIRELRRTDLVHGGARPISRNSCTETDCPPPTDPPTLQTGCATYW